MKDEKDKSSISQMDGKDIETIEVYKCSEDDESEKIKFSIYDVKSIAEGTFGKIYQAKLLDVHELIAIKKVKQDPKYKNRELDILKKLSHLNICKIICYNFTKENDKMYLYLYMDYMPSDLFNLLNQFAKKRQLMPTVFVQIYSYQIFRALGHIHSLGFAHRDIKPQNILVNHKLAILKLCDFGSAKELKENESNISYICSRYYRAPELIFGATNYTTKIDIWSAACVLGELLLGRPLFQGNSSVSQLVEIVKVLGTPTKDQVKAMNPAYFQFNFPQLERPLWSSIFRPHTPVNGITLLYRLLRYDADSRLTAMQTLTHHFYHDLRHGNQTLPNGRKYPELFNYTENELSMLDRHH